MTDSTGLQRLVVPFAAACLISCVSVAGCSSNGNKDDVDVMMDSSAGDADVVISDTLVDSSTRADAVDIVLIDARDALMADSSDSSDDIVTDSGAWGDAVIDSEAPDAMTDVQDVFVDADVSVPVDADDVTHQNDANVIPETDTHEIECVTGPDCTSDDDCPSFEGRLCNLALDPPQCQLLACGDVSTACSDQMFCTSGACFNSQCCQPACDGLECGADGCGGSCGECTGDGAVCAGGHCCVPNCYFFQECGPDPVCDVECGPCPEGSVCMTDFTCFDVSGMAYVDAGSFWMGCNEGIDTQCVDGEKPYHEVTLSDYYIDRTEVTVDRYIECLTAGACKVKGTEYTCNFRSSVKGNHPVNCVTWYQANDYCAWAGKRLPTEAEWEKAARGTDGRKYPWGNEWVTCEYAVMWEFLGVGCDDTNSTWEVCSKSPAGDSPYGLCDMSGNVSEWVSDWYDEQYYINSPSSNPTGPVSGGWRVSRGGSYDSTDEYFLRASARGIGDPSIYYHQFGFRCAKDAP